MVLVGPSGCGKSTTLRMVAGLEEITAGTIMIGDRIVNDVAPKDRDIAMVFQNYALYPHMTVRENMAFGLKLRKFPKAEIERARQEAADARHRADCSTGSRRRSPAASGSASPRPRNRAQAHRVPLRRTALEPRRQAARADARPRSSVCTCGSAPR
jgi:ABC-type Fe3+/spermidine/putrescine transport system ATPase subunit